MHPIHFAIKTLTAAGISILLITPSYAATKPDSANSNSAQVVVENAKGTSQEEIATIDVLNEICPQILGQNNTKNFRKGYSNLLRELLPSIKNPVLSVQSMHTDPDYMNILANARTKAFAEKVEDNREVCLEVLHYPTPKK
ncbi:MAG: hypothetical protein H7Z73_07405 [Candidatus Saccharibacteria bacterium]|nr:hypothetical protein [Moraxellaceae bacterium]